MVGSKDVLVLIQGFTGDTGMLQICVNDTDGVRKFLDWVRGECILICSKKYVPGSSGRLIQDVPVVPSKIRRWLDLCEAQHDEPCKRSVKLEVDSSLMGLRLIDVFDMRIVERPWSTKYFALSYVWGGVQQLCLLKSNRDVLAGKGALSQRISLISRTVRDAIEFVRLLGDRYLWVDCLCLTNDDQEELNKGINSMFKVYDEAYATIVAANGDSAEVGLPRVSKAEAPPKRPFETIKPGLSVIAVTYLDECLKRSAWYTRGWT